MCPPGFRGETCETGEWKIVIKAFLTLNQSPLWVPVLCAKKKAALSGYKCKLATIENL